MLPILTLSLFALAQAAAPVLTDSPTGVVYKATFNKTVDGLVEFSSQNGSVLVSVDISGLPDYGGPFQYHIHEKPVPANGSCLATLGHLNPYNGNVNATTPSEKEVGDLSGKHGFIEGTSIETSYIDPYLSLNPSNKAYLGGLSVVIHFANTTRLACANIYEMPQVEQVNGGGRLAAGIAAPLIAGAAALLL